MSGRTVGILRGLNRLLLGMAVFLAIPAVAQAATVTNTLDSGTGSLRDAIALANAGSPGSTIDFAPGLSGTITLTSGVLSVTQSVNIVGPGAGSITVSGAHNTTVFDIAPSVANQDVTISGLTISGGTATTNGGGILANDFVRTLTLSGDTITGNQVTLNSASGGGGGVYLNGGTLIVSGSTIDNNTVTITGSANNVGGGGGLYDNGGNVEVTTSTMRGNTVTINSSNAVDGGGAIYSNGGGVNLVGATISGNSLTIGGGTANSSGGGGIYRTGAT